MGDREWSGGVVTVLYHGKIYGSEPDLNYQGEKGCFYVEGDAFCEFTLGKYLRLKGVDLIMVKGYFFKAPNQPLKDFRRINSDGFFF